MSEFISWFFGVFFDKLTWLFELGYDRILVMFCCTFISFVFHFVFKSFSMKG